MARIKIDLPERLPFSTQLAVRVQDLNYGNHLSNDRFLAFAHEARLRYLRSLGYESELQIEGIGLIMGDAAVVFKQQAFFGDVLRIEVGAGDFSRVSFDLFYRFVHAEKAQEIGIVKTGMVCFDYDKTQRVASVPENLKAKLIA